MSSRPEQQPRALGLGVIQPTCVFLCFATNTQTDSEGNGAQSVQSVQSPTVELKAGANR